MKSKFLVLILGLTLAGCGTKTQEIIVDGAPGAPGQDGISMGIDVSNSAPSCIAGGSTLKTFVDTNRNGDLDTDEVIKKVAVICNGVNGVDGQDGIDGTSVSVATASASQCPTGGVLFTAGLITTAICNGEKGDMGPAGANGLNGAAGPQGIAGKSAYEIWLDAGNVGDENDFLASLQGQDGANGSNGINGANGLSAYDIWLSLGNTGTPSQFISSLTGPQGQAGQNGLNGSNGLSAYQIWLSLGNTGTEAQFIASLKGATGATGATGPQGPQGTSDGVGNLTPVQLCPGDTATFKEYGFIVGTDLFAVYFDKNQPIAFLAKLKPGNYVTTNGSNCQFSYANNGTTLTLSNGNGTTTVNLTNSGSGSNTLAGQCSVVKFNDFQSEQQFHFAVTGMASYSSYTLEVTFNNGSVVNQVQDSNGGASTYVSPLYTIAPQNLANGFDFYAKHNGNVVNKPTVASAKVKKNGQEMTCTVSN